MMPGCCIVKSRLATHVETHIASDHGYHSHDLIWLFCVLLNRHIVCQLNDAFFGKESRKQNIRIRKVKLTYAHVGQLRANLKSAAFVIIQESSKHCWRFEIRIAQEIDGTVRADRCNGLHVPDHAVIFYWLKALVNLASPSC